MKTFKQWLCEVDDNTMVGGDTIHRHTPTDQFARDLTDKQKVLSRLYNFLNQAETQARGRNWDAVSESIINIANEFESLSMNQLKLQGSQYKPTADMIRKLADDIKTNAHLQQQGLAGLKLVIGEHFKEFFKIETALDYGQEITINKKKKKKLPPLGNISGGWNMRSTIRDKRHTQGRQMNAGGSNFFG